MELHSLGRKTDLIFARFAGSIIDKGSYLLVQTPSNPSFHWGNFIIFDRPPRKGDYRAWTELFDKEYPYYKEPNHYTFTWDTGRDEIGEWQEFAGANFELDSAVVLTAKKLNMPPHLNESIVVRRISTDQEWNDVLELQILCSDPKYFDASYEDFKRRQIDMYRKMAESGKGSWFGAFLKNTMVGDLGIFYEADLARYQNVGTHPNYRRQGICGTLVYKAGLIALQEFRAQQLVMEADPEYHAARVYESVGFRRREVNHALSWWAGKKQ